MEYKFQIGDRVRLQVDHPDNHPNLKTGAVGGGPSYSAVTERVIEPALETAMPELDPAFTDLL